MVDKELDKIYEAVEVAKATGKIRKGTNETTKAIEKGDAKLVVIAKDVTPPEIIMHIPVICKEKGIACAEVPSKEELGAAAGLDIGTSSIAIVQPGEAKSLLKDLGGKPAKEKKAEEKEEEPAEEPKEEKPKEKKAEKKEEKKEEKAEEEKKE